MLDNTQQTTGKRQEAEGKIIYDDVIIDDRTTEEKTASVRKTMRFYRPYQTACRGHGRIDGWYYTEPETIYGECTA